MKKFENYQRNLKVLARAGEQDLANEFIVGGIIDKFFIQFELGWKLLKEFLRYEGRAVAATGSPRSIIKEAYQTFDFLDEEIWLQMLEARNDLSHIYDGRRAGELARLIISSYLPEFQRVADALLSRYGDRLGEGQEKRPIGP